MEFDPNPHMQNPGEKQPETGDQSSGTLDNQEQSGAFSAYTGDTADRQPHEQSAQEESIQEPSIQESSIQEPSLYNSAPQDSSPSHLSEGESAFGAGNASGQEMHVSSSAQNGTGYSSGSVYGAYPGQGQSAASYKAYLKQMKQEMKRLKQEEKYRARRTPPPNTPGVNGSLAYPGGRKGVTAGPLVGIMVACIAIGCALAILLITFFPTRESSLLAYLVKQYGNSQTTIQQSGNGGNITIKNEMDSVAKAVYAKAAQSVVGIRVVAKSYNLWQSAPETIQSEGSGVVYTADGLIVTNHHVVNAAIENGKIKSGLEIRIYLDPSLKQYHVAELLGFDKDTDLALLKIQVTGMTPIEFANYEDLEVGETAIAIGSPGGLEYMNSISEGIVSGIERDITTAEGVSFALIQTTAAINPGNSGGALLNSKGQLIGICVIKIADTEYEGMGFAINTDTIKSIIGRIQEGGTVSRPTLGVRVDTQYNSTLASTYGYPEGAYIHSVDADSCAEKGGMKGQDIIIEFAGSKITSFQDLKKSLAKCEVGQTVKVKIFRVETKTEHELSITLE